MPDLLHVVFEALDDHKINYMRAPYSAWAQLAYLKRHPRQYITAVVGGSELLMFDVDKIISSIDFQRGKFSWISKKAVLADLGLNDEQFLDVCIFAGFEYCTTFPPLQEMSFTFKSTLELIKQYKSGFNAAQSYADHPEVSRMNYTSMFCRTRCAVKYHIILTEDGRTEPLNLEDAPNDIHEFIGYRLPEEVYRLLSQNLISPQVINNLISGNLTETSPLSNGETLEYRRLLTRLLDLRTLSLALLTRELHPFYQQRRVTSVHWFEPHIEHLMPHDKISQQNGSIGQKPLGWWRISHQFLQEEAARLKFKRLPDMLFIMRVVHRHAAGGQLAVISRKGDGKAPLNHVDEVVANVIGRVLELRGFLSANHTILPFGRALLDGCNLGSPPDGGSGQSGGFQCELFTALELARLGILHSGPYSQVYSGRVDVGADDERKNILLITRAVSLVSMNFKGVPWTGPVSRELLTFNDIAKGLTRSLRNLCEMVILAVYLSGGMDKEHLDLHEIHKCHTTAFVRDYNTAMGVVANLYLESLVGVVDKGACAAAANAAESKFSPWCADVKGDLKKAFRFWDQIVQSINTLKTEKAVTEELAQEFKSADRWLASRRAF